MSARATPLLRLDRVGMEDQADVDAAFDAFMSPVALEPTPGA